MSEENKLKPFEERKEYTHFFCVDPLDGTKASDGGSHRRENKRMESTVEGRAWSRLLATSVVFYLFFFLVLCVSRVPLPALLLALSLVSTDCSIPPSV